MTSEEMMVLDELVSKALGRHMARESIRDAAERVMRTPKGNRAWRVAREILRGRGEPWTVMKRAAKAARRAGLA